MSTKREASRRRQVLNESIGQDWFGYVPEPYVVRVCNPDFNGWRFQRFGPDSEPLEQAYFSCAKHGGELQALFAANDFARSRLDSRFAYGAHRKNARNEFGIVGVHIIKNVSKTGAVRSVCWSANWTEECGQVRRSYPIMVYGYEGAFLNAAWDRIRAVGEQPGLDPQSPPEPPPWLSAWMACRGLC